MTGLGSLEFARACQRFLVILGPGGRSYSNAALAITCWVL